MKWLPNKKAVAWWWISLLIAGLMLAVSVLGTRALLPNAEPKYVPLALFCLVIGLIIGTAGWLGARWFPPIATLGLAAGLGMMLANFTGLDGWGDLVGILNLLFFLVGGMALGAIVELILWFYRRKQ